MRHYPTKGDAAYRVKLSIPITEATMTSIERAARAAGVGKTEWVRTAVLGALVEAVR